MGDWSEDVLEAGFVDEYKRGMQFFHTHLVELHMNIFILEKVLAFPFGIFLAKSTSLYAKMRVRT